MKRIVEKLFEDKTYQEDTRFFDGLSDIVYDICDNFHSIFAFFWSKEIDENGKIILREADEKDADLKLNGLYRILKGQLKKLINYMNPFINIDQRFRYLYNYKEALENINDTLDYTIKVYNRTIKNVPEKYKSTIDGQFSAFMWLLRGLNTGFRIYNQTEIGRQRPLKYLVIPEPQFIDFRDNATDLNTTIQNFKQYMDNFIKKAIKEYDIIQEKLDRIENNKKLQ